MEHQMQPPHPLRRSDASCPMRTTRVFHRWTCGSASTTGLLVIAAVLLIAFLVWQATATQKSVVAKDFADGDSGRVVGASPPLAAAVERPVKRLRNLSELPSAGKGSIVHAVGLVVDIVDRPGVPFRVTIADGKGVAEVVCFTPSDEFRSRVRDSECVRLDARVDTYRGGFQLEPVAFSLVTTGSAEEVGLDASLRPSSVSRYSDLREGEVVAIDTRVLSATPTRTGGGMHGEFALPNGDRVRYLWSDPPAEAARADRVRAFARVGSYEQKLQLRPFTVTASLTLGRAAATEGHDEPADMNDWYAEKDGGGIEAAMRAGEGQILRIRGIVADVVESEKVPFMVTLADETGSAKVVIGEAPEVLRARLRAAAMKGEVLSLEARVTLYRNEKQLQPVDRSRFEYLDGSTVAPPSVLERGTQLRLGAMFFVEGVVSGSRMNRAGGLNGGIRIPSGEVVDFIWWSPPSWARDGARVAGFARVGEFRGLQLELTSSMQRMGR